MPHDEDADGKRAVKSNENKKASKAVFWTVVVSWLVGFLAIVGAAFIWVKEPERVGFMTTNVLSLSLLIVAGVQAYIYGQQWVAMRRGLTQNRRAIRAAQKSANVAEKNRIEAGEQWRVQERLMIEQAGALTAQANAYAEMVRQNERLVHSAEVQAEAAREQADIAWQQFHAVARPYLSIKNASLMRPLTAGKKLAVKTILTNTGLVEAHARMWNLSVFCCTSPPPDRLRYFPSVEYIFDVAPGRETNTDFLFYHSLTQEEVVAVQNGAARLYFYSRGEYGRDGGTTYPFNVCFMYFGGRLIACPSGVEIVEEQEEGKSDKPPADS